MEGDMNELIPNEVGLWIECCAPNCKKWRYVLDIDDPLTVPELWYCNMNSDKSTNTCSTPERLTIDEDEVFVESKYKAGSIVSAKVIGFPWYPAMVDYCPDFETYYWFDNPRSNVPTQYHVTFFGLKNPSRAWIKDNFIKPFVANDEASVLKSRVRGKKLTFKQQRIIRTNYKIARAALTLPISKRLKKYGNKFSLHSQRLQKRSDNAKRRSSTVVGPSSQKSDSILDSISKANLRSCNDDDDDKIKSSMARAEDKKKTSIGRRQPLAELSENNFGDVESGERKTLEEKKSHLRNAGCGISELRASRIANKPCQEDSATTLQSSMITVTNSTATTNGEYEDSNDTESVNSSNYSAPTNARRALIPSRLPGILPVKRLCVDERKEENEIWKERRAGIIERTENEEAEVSSGDKDVANDEINEITGAEESSWETIPGTPQPGPSRLSLQLKSLRERSNKRDLELSEEQGSKSEGFSRDDSEKKEKRVVEKPARRRRYVEQFSSLDKHAIVENLPSIKADDETYKGRKLPEWFSYNLSNPQREAENFNKLFTESSVEIYERIQRESRESILSDIYASSGISSLEGNSLPMVAQPENTGHLLLTSDDDSFEI